MIVLVDNHLQDIYLFFLLREVLLFLSQDLVCVCAFFDRYRM
jgi:hypothetical protein